MIAQSATLAIENECAVIGVLLGHLLQLLQPSLDRRASGTRSAVMASNDLDSLLKRDSTYMTEVWTWFGIGVTVIFIRFGVRIRMVGFRGFQGDDYVTIMVSS